MEPQVKIYYGPPGTGKTRTLVNDIGDHIKAGDKITFVAFTRAAAAEATSRVKSDLLNIRTLHSLAFAFLGMGNSSVVDARKLVEFSAKTGILFKAIEKAEESQEGDEFQAVLSYANNRKVTTMEAYDHFGRPGTLQKFGMFLESYAAWKESTGFLDYDDMLMRFRSVLTNSPGTIGRWPVLFIDEAQDLSPLQWDVVRLLCRGARRVYVAGDDDQAIFEWNGADPHGMESFANDYRAAVHVLSQSYRVPVRAFEFATKNVLSLIERRKDKRFAPRNAAGRVLRYGDISDVPWSKHADKDGGRMILVRDQYRRAEVERMLNADMIPYRSIGGQSPFDNRYARALRGFNKLRRHERPTPSEQSALEDSLISPEMVDDVRYGDLREVPHWRNMVHVPAHLHHFYESVDLDAPLNTVVSTIHQAKGKEHTHVIVDLTLSPRTESSAQLDRDAEARVMYVAMTRASEELVLCGENSLIS